jgi:hypothetical protein
VAPQIQWVLWLAVHLLALTGFKKTRRRGRQLDDRVPRRGRAQRVIMSQQVFAQHALEAQGGVVPPEPMAPRPAARAQATAS